MALGGGLVRRGAAHVARITRDRIRPRRRLLDPRCTDPDALRLFSRQMASLAQMTAERLTTAVVLFAVDVGCASLDQ